MFEEGTAIKITQQSNTTKVIVDVDISNLSATTSLSASDLIMIEEASGGAIKKITHSNFIDSGSSQTQTLKNKTMEIPFSIFDSSADHKYVFAVSELASDRTTTLPLLGGNDTFVFEAHTQTLTNKTLTTPIISSISNSGTITLPTSTDTLVGRATTDTLTNKTLSTSSTWNGNTIAYNYGGTAQTSWTKGDILYADANNSLAKLSIGAQGKVLKVDTNDLPSWDTDNDTNYFTQSSPNIYPTNASDNFLVGTSSNGVSAKLYVDGTTYLVGDEIVITGEKNSTSSTSTTFTVNGKGYDASATAMVAYTEMIKVVNAQKSGSADKDPTIQIKGGNVVIKGTETDGSSRENAFSLNGHFFNATSGAVEDYDHIIQVLNPIAGGSTNYPKLQMKLENTYGSDGQVPTVNSSGHISWATPATSQWTLSSSSLYPLSTATNVLVGTTSNSSSRKIMCNGAFEATGIVVGSFSGANSFSFIDGKFYNDANRTVYLDHNASQYGYGQRGIDSGGSVYTDFYTYTQSSGTAISSCGSYSNCRFALFSDDINFLCSVPGSRGWVTMGQAIAVSDTHTPLAQLHIENDLSNMNAGDTRILIKSKSSTHDSSLLLSVNENSDGTGSYVDGEVYVDSGGDLYLRGANVKVVDNSAVEYVRFDRNQVSIGDCDLLITDTPTKGRTSFSTSSATTLRIQGGTGFASQTGWGSTGGEYQMLTIQCPVATTGSWILFVEDISTSVSYLGWFFGSGLQMYLTNSGSLYSRTTWTQSDSRIKTNITTDGVGQKCIDIIKRIPVKQYNYKQELINSTEDYTDKKVFGWIADDWYNDSEVNYLSNKEEKPREYYNENKELLLEVKDCKNIRKADIGSITYGAVGELIKLVEAQQAKITTLEDELESIKVILENNNLV